MYGRILSIGQTLTTPSKDGTKTYTSRSLVLDCTTTSSTGQVFKSTPQFEFDGNLCPELDKYVAGQLVAITFELRGVEYIDKKTNAPKIFNRIRPYKIEPYQPAGYGPQPAQPAMQQSAQPAYPPQQPVAQPAYPPQQGVQPPYPQQGYQQPAYPPQAGNDNLPF